MNKGMLAFVVIVIIILVAGGAGYYLYTKPNNQPATTAQSTTLAVITTTVKQVTTTTPQAPVSTGPYVSKAQADYIFAPVVNSTVSESSFGAGGQYSINHCGPNNNTNSTLCGYANYNGQKLGYDFNTNAIGWIATFGAYGINFQEVSIPDTANGTAIYAASVKLASDTEAMEASEYAKMHFNYTFPTPTINGTTDGAVYSIFPNISTYTTAIYVSKGNYFASILTGGVNYNSIYTGRIVSMVASTI